MFYPIFTLKFTKMTENFMYFTQNHFKINKFTAVLFTTTTKIMPHKNSPHIYIYNVGYLV